MFFSAPNRSVFFQRIPPEIPGQSMRSRPGGQPISSKRTNSRCQHDGNDRISWNAILKLLGSGTGAVACLAPRDPNSDRAESPGHSPSGEGRSEPAQPVTRCLRDTAMDGPIRAARRQPLLMASGLSVERCRSLRGDPRVRGVAPYFLTFRVPALGKGNPVHVIAKIAI